MNVAFFFPYSVFIFGLSFTLVFFLLKRLYKLQNSQGHQKNNNKAVLADIITTTKMFSKNMSGLLLLSSQRVLGSISFVYL